MRNLLEKRTCFSLTVWQQWVTAQSSVASSALGVCEKNVTWMRGDLGALTPTCPKVPGSLLPQKAPKEVVRREQIPQQREWTRQPSSNYRHRSVASDFTTTAKRSIGKPWS